MLCCNWQPWIHMIVTWTGGAWVRFFESAGALYLYGRIVGSSSFTISLSFSCWCSRSLVVLLPLSPSQNQEVAHPMRLYCYVFPYVDLNQWYIYIYMHAVRLGSGPISAILKVRFRTKLSDWFWTKVILAYSWWFQAILCNKCVCVFVFFLSKTRFLQKDTEIVFWTPKRYTHRRFQRF